MKIIRLAAVALAVMAASIVTIPTPADAKNMCLPSSRNGHTTSVGFQPSWYGRGKFNGIVVRKIAVPNAAVSIANRNGTVYFNGPISVGQYIALPKHWDLIWTGWSDKNHMNGICVEAQY